MDLLWAVVNYAGRLFLPIATYRLARVDGNSRQASLGAAALTTVFGAYADISM
ncbi:MAG: hypothetical protein AABX75_02725 [Nanoarchaeota archaeon]